MLLTSAGCAKKDTDNIDAVKQGVIKYLSKRTDLAAMDVSVASVQFRGNEADAKVHFQAKNNTNPAAALDMTYVLERKGDNWEVKGRSGTGAASGANPHGAMPPSGGAMPDGAAPQGTLPPGHPAVPPGGAMPGSSQAPQG